MPKQQVTGLQAYYRLIITDKDGKVEWKSRKHKSRSFVLQFLQLLGGLMKLSHTGGIADTSGSGVAWAVCAAPNTDTHLWSNSSAGDQNTGIVVGTGITTPANSDYKLATQIAHGIGSGQLSYGSVSFTEAAIAAGNVDLIITRAFTNGSGGAITVREIGLYVKDIYGYTSFYFCVIRDVLGTAKTVDDGKTLTVQYTLETTV